MFASAGPVYYGSLFTVLVKFLINFVLPRGYEHFRENYKKMLKWNIIINILFFFVFL